jgi:Predicted pPIWI-associating nuclease
MVSYRYYEQKLLILRQYAKIRCQSKYNFLGKLNAPGDLEQILDKLLSQDERNTYRKGFEELVQGDFLRSTMADLGNPDAWFEITDKGRAAVDRDALDELDEVLLRIDRHLVQIRRGAWSALMSEHSDSLRQAAHSGRELIEQTIKTGAPDAEVRARQDYVPDKTSRDGVTRKMRIRHLMEKHRGHISASDLDVVEKAIALVLSIDDSLTAASHARSEPVARHVEDALTTAEAALRRVLLG